LFLHLLHQQVDHIFQLQLAFFLQEINLQWVTKPYCITAKPSKTETYLMWNKQGRIICLQTHSSQMHYLQTYISVWQSWRSSVANSNIILSKKSQSTQVANTHHYRKSYKKLLISTGSTLCHFLYDTFLLNLKKFSFITQQLWAPSHNAGTKYNSCNTFQYQHPRTNFFHISPLVRDVKYVAEQTSISILHSLHTSSALNTKLLLFDQIY
jgi:hypothetical protein